MREEEKQFLSKDRKTLMTHGKYSETLVLSKPGLRRAWEIDCEEKGKFQSFKDWLKQEFTVLMWMDSEGVHILLELPGGE